MANAMTSSASNNSPGASDNGQHDSSADKASQTQNRSLQKVAFRRDVLFENVCCMPSSSLSTSKPSRLLQRSGRKARTGSSTGDAHNDKSSRTSESHGTCGKGFCFKDDSVNGEEEEEDGERLKAPDESSGIPGSEKRKKNAPTSTEPRGEGLANLLTSSGGRPPSDVVHRSAAATETVDFQVDSNVSRIQRPPKGVVGADVNTIAGSDGLSGPHPPSSVTGQGTVEGNLSAPVAASNELPSREASSSDAVHRPHPQPQQQQHVHSSGDILWEFNGRRLSNVCRNLMTESVEALDGETDHPTVGTVAVANDGSIGDERSSSSSSSNGNGCHSTDKYNHREFSTDATPMKRETADDLAASSFRDKTTSDAFNSSGEPPPPPLLRVLSDSPRRNNRPIISDTKMMKKMMKSRTIDTRLDVDANSAEFVSVDDKQNAAAAIATDPCEGNSSSSPGKVRIDDRSGAGKWSFRRGRTLERGNYDAGLLLKDFIRPDQKKFSVAPDFNIDTELAIWEPSDYAPDGHKAVQPAAAATEEEEASLKPARDKEPPPPPLRLMRSRQTSVSPKRQRIAGRRRSKGSKSVEILGSRNRSCPVGAQLLGRRTVSKEWQILTFTTTEEITTLIRPSAATKDDPLEPGLREIPLLTLKLISDANKNKALPANDTKTELSISTHDAISSNAIFSASSEASTSDIPEAADIPFHTNSHDKSDTVESSLPSFSNDYIGSRIGDARTDISEALPDVSKEVDLAEDASSTVAEKQSTRSATETLAVSSTLRNDDISPGILPTEEEVSDKENNSLECERRLDEDSIPPIEKMDELVKALMNLASNKTHDETLKQELSHSHDESSSDLSKLSAEEFLDFSNNNVLRRPPVQRSDEGDHQLNSNFNRLHFEADSSFVSQNESEFLTENNHNKTPSPELTEDKHTSGLDEIVFDDDDDNYDAMVDNDLTLHITEDSDHLSPAPSFRATESVEHIPADQVDDRVGRPEEDTAAAAAAAAAVGASSEGGSCRPRVVSKQGGDAADATAAASRRRSDSSGEVLPDKAFLESVISSLGTIIFLLLAALIFHLFNRFVDHEL